MKKIIRIAAVPLSLSGLLTGQLNFLNKHYTIIGVCSDGDQIEELKKQEGIQVIPVNIERKISIFKDVISLYKLYKVFKVEKPFMVHSITPKAGLLSMLASYLAAVPIRVHTFTGLIFPYKTGLMQKILLLMDRILCKCATHVYPEGQGVKNHLEQYNITNKPLTIVANGNVNGIDLDHFNPSKFSQEAKSKIRQLNTIDKTDFVFLFVGRLVTDKGVNELVQAFTMVKNTNPRTKLLLVGDYEHNLDPLQANTIEEIKSNKDIIMVGWQTDVRPYLAIADLFVLPSYREGFPNVVLQAASFNLACIVTDISGSNEIISNNINGVIVPVKEINLLAKQMILLLMNAELRISFAKNARALIIEKYDRQYVWKCLLEEYRYLESQYNG
jgi:glycosyltransferase involved in cell wall biosynthesis